MEINVAKKDGWFFNPQLRKFQNEDEVKVYGVDIYEMIKVVLSENRDMNFQENRAFVKAFNKHKSKSIENDVFTRKTPEIDDIIFEEETPKPFSLGVPGNFTLNPEIMKKLGVATGLYLILIQLRVRNRYSGDKLKIYDRYWKEKKLATGTARGELCRRLGIKRKRTITAYTQQLKNGGIIKIERLHPNECFDGQQHNVYILGTHEGKKNEHFLIEDL